jgi:hypothetical protein
MLEIYFAKSWAKTFMELKETEHLTNAYYKFGDLLFIEHWWKARDFRPGLLPSSTRAAKVVNLCRSTSKRTGKPLWWCPVYQLDYRPAERLSMNLRLETTLITKNGCFPKDVHPSTPHELETICRRYPKNDWRIELMGAFESLIYQRQGRNKWFLISVGKGYA